jgi:uncharacterized protein (TIGR03067 family)
MCWSYFLILLASLGTAGAPSDAAVKKELERFQGNWQAVSIQHVDGRLATEAELRVTRLVVEGNKFTLTGKDYSITGTFTIDPTRKPRTIDVMLANSKKPEEKILGIYQMKGGTRKSCFAFPGTDRPGDFQSAGKGYLRLEWKRQSP